MARSSVTDKKKIKSRRLSDSLKFIMKAHEDISSAELSRKTNIPQTTLHKILTEQTSDPRLSTLLSLANFFEITLEELVGLEQNELGIAKKISGPIKSIPIISWEQCIYAKETIEKLNENNWQDWQTVNIESNNAFALLSKVCMEPLYPRGTVLIIDPELKPTDGDFVVVHYKNTDEATLRQISIDGPYRKLFTINENEKPDILDKRKNIIGVVFQARFMRSTKK